MFQYIGKEDKRSFVRLAICSDQELECFIYTECTYLWRELDLHEFPGITDVQLKSLLERIHAQAITRTIVLDKTSDTVITGAGLEPLRGSKVLESIDLRQSVAYTRGPTSLNDELVTDILSTMIPHKLDTVKVRKQYHNSTDFPLDEYCFPWSSFFAKIALEKSRNLGSQVCSHCNRSMTSVFPYGQMTTRHVLTSKPMQCSACKIYSCNRYACPSIRECQTCLEWACPCRGEVQMCNYCSRRNCPGCDPQPLSCHGCGNTSCSNCNRMIQCKQCQETLCEACQEDIFTCVCCDQTFCNTCTNFTFCEVCFDVVCPDCDTFFEKCDSCQNAHVCRDCQDSVIIVCQSCSFRKCFDCSRKHHAELHACSYCPLTCCADNHMCMDAFQVHVCKPPGELLYSARDARQWDHEANLCTCGKKHLSSPEGQQFMCSWVQK